MTASDPQMPWITRGSKCCPKDQDYLDPYAWYDFFDSADNSARSPGHRKHHMRAKSAAPRTSRPACTKKHAEGWSSSASSTSLRNPSPTPATSPPASLKCWRCPGRTVPKTTKKLPAMASPTSLYLGSHRLRCKSAPPAGPFGVQPPQRPKTSKPRQGSAKHSSHNAPKRAWHMRTNSAKTHHALLSPEEVQKHHKVRCKSAPLPYDFSAIELVAKIPEEASDTARLKAMTRPLTCMPDIVKNVLSHNGIKHCCSAYATRPKIAPDTRQQFWPVSRPSMFHRGNVPKYLHFVQPICPGSKTPRAQSTKPQSLSETGDDTLYNVERTDISLYGSDAADLDEPVLYEEQFLIPMTPSEPSVSEQWQSDGEDEGESQRHDARVILSQDLMQRYLEDVSNHEREVLTLPEDPEPLDPLKEDEQDLEEVVIKNRQMPEQEGPVDLGHDDVGELSTQNDEELRGSGGELQGEGTEQKGDGEEAREDGAENSQITPLKSSDSNGRGEMISEVDNDIGGLDHEEPLQSVAPASLELPSEPVEAVAETPEEIPSKEGDSTKDLPNMNTDLSQFKPQSNQVTFLDSMVLTSYKSPISIKAETKEAVKPILKLSMQAPIVSESPVKQVEPPKLELPKKKVKPLLDRRGADLRPQTKENQPWALKVKHEEEEPVAKDNTEEKKEVEKKEKRTPPVKEVLIAKPKYIPARGAYKMYQAQDLLQYHLEQSREKRQVPRKSIPVVMPFKPWMPESATIVNTVLEEEKRKKEGLKPWLQGRLALSKQTSRFELPMDIRVLEAMTPLEYLMKYCIISTRRKALYKHVFQKVDRDRDNKITFKEFDKALKEIHVASINSQKILTIAELVEVNEKSIFSPDQFAAIAAFSERLLFSDFATPETSSKTHDSKEIIEEADFCGLKSKLNGFKINPPVRKILEIL